MASTVKAIPAGYHTATPYLVVSDGARAIDYYKKAFDAKEMFRMGGPEGKIGHAEIKIGDSMIMLSDEMMGNRSPQSLGGSPVSIFLYVEDVDSVFNGAVSAGAKADMPPQNMFWGDRCCVLQDIDGYEWTFSTNVGEHDLSNIPKA